MTEFLRGAADVRRWSRALMLLSLDRTAQFIVDLELVGFDISVLRKASQGCTEQLERLSASGSFESYVEVFSEANRQVRDSSGGWAKHDLVSWVEQAFPADHLAEVQPFIWTSILRTVRQQPRVLEAIELSTEKKHSLQKAALTHLDAVDRVSKQIEIAETRPKTEWDQHVYSIYAPDCSPLDLVSDAVIRLKFADAWREIRSFLTQQERIKLLEWAQDQAPTMNMPPRLLENPDRFLAPT